MTLNNNDFAIIACFSKLNFLLILNTCFISNYIVELNLVLYFMLKTEVMIILWSFPGWT